MNPYSTLAKEAIRQYLNDKSFLKPEKLDEKFKAKAGVFVSLKKQGQLRGCIGTFFPTQENIGQEIIKNAIAAAFGDPRFPALTKDELDKIEISVDILKEPQRAVDLEELDPKKYGVIVKTEDQQKVGLLLPDLEGVTTPEEQVSIACGKAGIDLSKEKIILYIFKVTRHDD